MTGSAVVLQLIALFFCCGSLTVPPSKVVGVRVTPGVSNTSSTLTVIWQAPAEGNVTYTVKYSTQPGELNTPPEGAFEVTGISSNSTILTALKRGTTYYIWVMGVSEGGEGPHSDKKSGVTLDNVPHPTDGSLSVVTLNEAGKVKVTWSTPTLGPGQVITGYSVQYRRRGTISYTTRSVSGSSTTSYTITNLKLGTVYEVRVASVGPLGLSGYCCGSGKQVTTSNILPPDEVHSYPLPQPGTVRVTWTVAPNSTHGFTLVGYSLLYREEGGDIYQSQQITKIPSPGELEAFELEGLKLGTTYELRVAVVTISGVGKYSDAINVTTYADCCSECSSIQSTMFVSFEVGMMKVDESDSLVHIDVFRYGPMSDPITLMVRDIPLTAKRVKDYSLQSSSLVFLNTERMVERSTVVVRIREDSIPEQDPPTESFRLVLSSSAAGGGMQPAVVFSVPEMEVHIRDNDY